MLYPSRTEVRSAAFQANLLDQGASRLRVWTCGILKRPFRKCPGPSSLTLTCEARSVGFQTNYGRRRNPRSHFWTCEVLNNSAEDGPKRGRPFAFVGRIRRADAKSVGRQSCCRCLSRSFPRRCPSLRTARCQCARRGPVASRYRSRPRASAG